MSRAHLHVAKCRIARPPGGPRSATFRLAALDLETSDEQRSTRHLYQRRRLAKRGVVFLAAASAGEQYGPELTVSDGTGEAIAVAADFESNIVVRCDEEDGNPVQEDLAMVQRYVASVRRWYALATGAGIVRGDEVNDGRPACNPYMAL